MPSEHNRIQRELKTITIMTELYCRDHHASDKSLCEACQGLLDYAKIRLQKCPFQERKTTCGNCSIHCYKPKFREMVRKVMRYSGPRMIYSHPLLAFGHMIDGFRKQPDRIKKATKINKQK